MPESEIPSLTIIRPVKGLEPGLYECLASTFKQDYPLTKFSVALCVSSEDDPAYPTLEKIVHDFSPSFDVRLYVEEYDPLISSLDGNELGPNPKIRNISRAYREAKGEVIWIMDCNVWISRGVAGKMVDRLLGLQPDGSKTTPFRFVHLLPLVVDIPVKAESTPSSSWARISRLGGGRLDEMFMATTHAKFYGAINTVGVAPCVIGKSNMFRKAHLDTYTTPEHNANLSSLDARRGRGTDFFSHYICEDHLIGDLLWNADIPGFLKHGLVWGELAIQPVSGVSIAAYWGRRVRWLRARKWTVLLATLVEPGVESLLCNLCFAYAATTLPFFNTVFGIPQTTASMMALWAAGVTIWMACDRVTSGQLHKCATIEVDENTPAFARGAGAPSNRPFLREWLPAWIGREFLAMPIWTWAVLLGTTVTWRGKKFKVHSDMSVHAMEYSTNTAPTSKKDGAGSESPLIQEKSDEHSSVKEVPKWEGRPTARQRTSRSKS